MIRRENSQPNLERAPWKHCCFVLFQVNIMEKTEKASGRKGASAWKPDRKARDAADAEASCLGVIKSALKYFEMSANRHTVRNKMVLDNHC